MTATFAKAPFAAEYMTTAVDALLRAVRECGSRWALPLIADALEDAGCTDAKTLAALRDGTWGRGLAGYQATQVGTEVVTVARDGARMAKCGPVTVAIYCTAIYRAERRKSDGVITWRRVGSMNDSTAGNNITSPMIARAKAVAEESGREYRSGVRHGCPCC